MDRLFIAEKKLNKGIISCCIFTKFWEMMGVGLGLGLGVGYFVQECLKHVVIIYKV